MRPRPRSGVFRRDGDVWSLVFEGRTTRVRDMVGLGAHGAAAARARPRHARHGSRRSARIRAPGTRPEGDAGELLDAQARADYEARLRDAREELDEAERMNDRGRAERLSEEIEFLTAELSRGFGLGGRPRRAGCGERARPGGRDAGDQIRHRPHRRARPSRWPSTSASPCAPGRSASYVPPARDRVAWTL